MTRENMSRTSLYQDVSNIRLRSELIKTPDIIVLENILENSYIVRVKSEFGLEDVVFSIHEQYPFKSPIALNIAVDYGWSPAMTLTQLALSIRAV